VWVRFSVGAWPLSSGRDGKSVLPSRVDPQMPPRLDTGAADDRDDWRLLDEPTCNQLRSRHQLRGAGAVPGELQLAQSVTLRRRATEGGSLPSTPSSGLYDAAGSSELHLGRFAALTALYAMVEGAATHPYELVKTRQQASASGALAHRMGTLQYFSYLRRTGGIGELYRGFSWAVVGNVPSEVVYYVGYTECKRILLNTSFGASSPSAVFLAAGAIADALSVLVSVPADVISQRLQLQGVDGCGQRERSGVQVALDIVRREGLLGLWRGTAATLAFFGPNSAVWWLTHEHAKAALSARLDAHGDGACILKPGAVPEVEPSNLVLVVSGALAGGVSTVITNPLDVVKTRLQTAAEPLPFSTVLRAVRKEAGWRGLYAGLVPRLLAVVPRSICSVVAYERAVEFCRKAGRRGEG